VSPDQLLKVVQRSVNPLWRSHRPSSLKPAVSYARARYDTCTDRNRHLYFAIVGWNSVLDGLGEGVREPMLSRKDKLDEVSRAFQLGMETGVYQFLRIRLGLRTGGV